MIYQNRWWEVAVVREPDNRFCAWMGHDYPDGFDPFAAYTRGHALHRRFPTRAEAQAHLDRYAQAHNWKEIHRAT